MYTPGLLLLYCERQCLTFESHTKPVKEAPCALFARNLCSLISSSEGSCLLVGFVGAMWSALGTIWYLKTHFMAGCKHQLQLEILIKESCWHFNKYTAKLFLSSLITAYSDEDKTSVQTSMQLTSHILSCHTDAHVFCCHLVSTLSLEAFILFVSCTCITLSGSE